MECRNFLTLSLKLRELLKLLVVVSPRWEGARRPEWDFGEVSSES